MAVSLNPLVGFSSTLQAKYQAALKSSTGAALIPVNLSNSKLSFRALLSPRRPIPNHKDRDFKRLFAAETEDGLTTEQTTETPSNGPPIITTPSQEEEEKPKRSPLTARERLRAARVLGRYNAESASQSASPKPKPDLGSKVLAALRESDRGKKTGLPEAPGNMLDDSKRGMPPKGLTFDLPGGSDLFFIVFSFVFITTIMFGTTFVVWKLGAIHFNEY